MGALVSGISQADRPPLKLGLALRCREAARHAPTRAIPDFAKLPNPCQTQGEESCLVLKMPGQRRLRDGGLPLLLLAGSFVGYPKDVSSSVEMRDGGSTFDRPEEPIASLGVLGAGNNSAQV